MLFFSQSSQLQRIFSYLYVCVSSGIHGIKGMWSIMCVLPLVYMVPKVCGPSCLCYLWYVADTRVDRHIAALLHEEKLPRIIELE